MHFAPNPFAYAHTAQPFPAMTGHGYNPYFSGTPSHGLNSAEVLSCFARVESQLSVLTEILRTQLGANPSFNQYGSVIPMNRLSQNYGGGAGEVNPIRLREMDSHIFWELALPHLTVGDVEVEVSGNRIICRTRVPVAAQYTWGSMFNMQLPRGFDFFQLPDGRIEYVWTCPVSFNAKEVEATFRDGFLIISLTKLETTTAGRHSIKVVSEKTGRRASGEMNS